MSPHHVTGRKGALHEHLEFYFLYLQRDTVSALGAPTQADVGGQAQAAQARASRAVASSWTASCQLSRPT